MVQASGGIPHDVPGLARTRVARGHCAGPTGFFGGGGNEHARLRDNASNCALLLVERERLNCAGEVFDCVELVIASHDSDSDRIYVGIEQVGTVAGRVHPEIVDDDGGGGFGYVFRDEAEVCANIGSAFRERRFSIELMGDFGVGGHLAGMDCGGFCEDGVEAKWLKSLIDAVFVRGGEKVLLGDCEIT